MSDIFISYSRRDMDLVQKIIGALTINNLDTWVDWKSIPKGEDWEQEIYQGIEESSVLLYIVSPDSVRSEMCRKEVAHAAKNGKRIIPVIINDVEARELPSEISRLNPIYCRQNQDDFSKAIEEINITIHTNYEWLKFHTTLQVKALEWERHNRDDSYLMRGRELQNAQTKIAANKEEPYLTELQQQYVTASRRRESRGIFGVLGSFGGRQNETVQSKTSPIKEQVVSQIDSQEVQPIEVGKLFSVSTDQASGDDKLNYARFADAFATLVQNPEAKTPITIGIYGLWGSGKSFLMKKIIQSLKGEQGAAPKKIQERLVVFFQRLFRRNTKPVDTIVIEFNAWVYSGSEHLWASLVTHLYREIEKYFGVRAPYHRLIKALGRLLPKSIGIFLFYAIPALLISLLIGFDNIQKTWDAANIALKAAGVSIVGGSLLATLPVLWSALREFADTLFLSRAMNLQKLAAKPDFHDQIGIMADIKSEIGFISHLLESRNKKKQTRVVLFIDDLDRCEHRKAVEVLQAIMLLLADRDGSPFVIFLGIDARIMVRAVEEHYGAVLVKAGINGYEYLDKIVQVPFVIPPANRTDIGNYIDSLIWTKAEKDLVASKFLPKEQVEPQKILDIPASELAKHAVSDPPLVTNQDNLPQVKADPVPVTFTEPEREALMACKDDIAENPRKIKRIFNIYRLVRLLLPINFQEYQKIVRWILLTEQWPLHASWIVEEIENDYFMKGKLSKKLNATILDVYTQIKDSIYSDDMDPLMTVDAEPIAFNQFIQKEPVFTVKEIKDNLIPLTFNLNPAIKSEISKYTARMAENYIQTKSKRKPRDQKSATIPSETKSATMKKAIQEVSEAEAKA
jgi:hypothetical protein